MSRSTPTFPTPLDPPPLPVDAPAPPPLPAPLAPVAESSRLVAVDVLRGVAVLGILGMNIISFALPFDAYVDPMNAALNRYAGAFTGANFVVWLVTHLLIDQKMMSIFSMLFGAGLVLMSDRAALGAAAGETRGGRFAGIYYRRLMWLLIIGLIHAYVFWYGDILVTYAICGVLLYPLRHWRPRTLIPLGVALMLVSVLIMLLSGVGMWYIQGQAQRGDPEAVKVWAELSAELTPTPQRVDADVAAFRQSPDVFRQNLQTALFFQLRAIPAMLLWRVLGLMLIGMALMKLGVFSAQCSNRFYVWMLALGYGVGLPLVAWGAFDQIAHEFDMIYAMLIGWHYNYLASNLVALGHVALVMLLVKHGRLQGLTTRLASVGRMALTNYLAQTLICTFIFFGWGLGWFGQFERKWLPLFVAGIWIVQLAYSPWWMRHFRFGPAEWLWRSLTYWKRQPFSRAALSAGTS